MFSLSVCSRKMGTKSLERLTSKHFYRLPILAMAEATTTLADALLDDLDDLSDGEEDVQEERNSLEADEADESEANTKGEDSNTKQGNRLLQDSALLNHLNAIKESGKRDFDDYALIVNSNKHLANLANELVKAHQDLCEAYKPKFPELEELVVDPIQYKNTVREIWNEMDLTKVNDGLNKFLTSNQIITISVAGSTTFGRPLSEEELKAVEEAATYLEDIHKVQSELTAFVENHMEGLAPSMCALIGSTTAAKLLGLAGGLAELSKIPACNLQVIGQVKQNSASRAGLSAATTKPHQGVLVECDLIQRCPTYLQKKALKVVAAKLALAARCDFVNADTGRPRTASSGLKFRREIETKIQQWITPDKAPVLKALPK